MAIPGNFLSETASTIDPNNSGWTPLLNCTLPYGIGGRVGTVCLAVASIAAGETRARTVSSYPVTAFEEYEAFSDASGTSVPERIGIRWLNASGTEISISWSLTTATASATWHRIAVADAAPATAVRAQVVLSATPAGAAITNFYENVYLGLPIRTTGNLLGFNTETNERATPWAYTAVTNCTIARALPMVSWAVDAYTSGAHVAAMTVTASSAANFRSTDLPAVVVGTEYLAYAYLNPPASGTAAWIELRFYDASLAQIQATKANLNAPGTGWYLQRVSDVAPATAAYASVAFGLDTATAAQVLRVDRAVITTAPVLREGSVVPYKDASFEAGIGGWTVVSGVATLARLTPWGTDGLDGSYCMTVSSATATTSVIRSAKYPVGAAAGQAWTAETGMKVSAGGWTLTHGIRWYDAANVDLGVTSAAPGAVPTPNWWILSQQVTAPAGATQAAIEYTLAATSVSSVVRMDKAAMWQSLPQVEITTDDTTASTQVTFRELTIDAAATVWRVLADGNRTLVRGASGLIDATVLVSDVLVVEDYEAPLGVPFSYYLETKLAGVIRDTRISDTVTLDPGDPNEIWIKDPGQPQRNLRVLVKQAPTWQRDIGQAEYRIRGRRDSVVLSDVRGGLQGDLVIWTRTDEERAGLHWILDSGNTLFWQATPGHGVDDMYVTVGQVTEARTGGTALEPWREWTLPLKQAAMPVTVGVAGSAGRTWQDILVEFATWGDVRDAFATWEDVLFNRRIS
ncbi:hypothetical protein ABT010_13515 [Streptomyces sp. NPDC002668]|uniref:hypothetical protein n=1 Tax=Streptomyces sp. NPDC002668 TaxID=3154422 RepID=UPI0033286E7A